MAVNYASALTARVILERSTRVEDTGIFVVCMYRVQSAHTDNIIVVIVNPS